VRLDALPLLISSTVFLVAGCAATTYLFFSIEGNFVHRRWGRYAARLEWHSSFLLLGYRGSQIALAQLIACSALACLTAVTRSSVFAFLTLLALAAPPFTLWKRHRARIEQLERQLDTWLLMLANALKATSSVGEAIASTVSLMPKPFSAEVDLLVKEIRLGAPLDRAINALARRIDSTVISGALATILVARQTGGDLSRTLEHASESLRESARLEGVLRSKTAEGRGQVLVLASVPFLLCIMIAWLDRSWFEPMLHEQVGQAVLGTCALLWLFATVWAHHIAKAEL